MYDDLSPNFLKRLITLIGGALMSFVTWAFGGWNDVLTALIVFMLVDFIIGTITACLGKSKKSQDGYLSSKESINGLIKKLCIILLLMVGYRLDQILNTTYIFDTFTYSFILSELISIRENLSLLGIKIPILSEILEVFNQKEEELKHDEEPKD